MKTPESCPEIVLFQTCYVQNNEPQIGRDTVSVLEKNKVSLSCAKGLKCCGMPAWETGDLETLRKNAHHNTEILFPFAKKGAKILAINPTCSMIMRREYKELLAPEYRKKAEVVVDAIRDPSEFLWSRKKEGLFNKNFKSSPGVISYHAPCHLRAQAIGFKGRDLLREIPGVKLHSVLECCGHDGTHAMKKEGFEVSIKYGQKAFSQMKMVDSEVWSTDCPLAALQFQQHAKVKPMHPMTILEKAYREDGFPQEIEKS